MKKKGVLVVIVIAYLVVFSAFYLHRTSSGLKRKYNVINKFKKVLKSAYESEYQTYEKYSQSIPVNEGLYRT